MRKYKVENIVVPKDYDWTNRPIADNYVGDSVAAETPEQAIEYAKEYIMDKINDGEPKCHLNVDGNIVVDETGETFQDFEAKE